MFDGSTAWTLRHCGSAEAKSPSRSYAVAKVIFARGDAVALAQRGSRTWTSVGPTLEMREARAVRLRYLVVTGGGFSEPLEEPQGSGWLFLS
ncbi:MAG: hypothetical protein QM784_30025 [Polyangiaceae bacterium]